MIKSWRHKGLKLFYDTGSVAKIQAKHADKLHDILQVLDFAAAAEQMNFPGLGLHKLQGDLKGHFAVKVSGHWRITFAFEGKNAIWVDYVDYH